MKNPLESIVNASAECSDAEAEKEPHHRRKAAFIFRLTGIHRREMAEAVHHGQPHASRRDSRGERSESAAPLDFPDTGIHR